MHFEQYEASIQDRLDAHELTAIGVCVSRQLLTEWLREAWTAGKNYGFHEGGRHVLDTFDAALVTKVRIAE